MQRKWFSILLVVAAILAIAIHPAIAASSTVVISEFRTQGPGVAGDGSDVEYDQFIELYNLSTSPVDIHGFRIQAWDPTDPDPGSNIWYIAQIVDPITDTQPIILQPYQHYLIAYGGSGVGFGYSGGSIPDLAFDTPFPGDAIGIALIAADGTTIIDAVSTVTGGATYSEGTALAPMTSYLDQSWERGPGTVGVAPNNGHINTTDSDDNANDFTNNNGITSFANPESLASGSPTAVTLRDLTAQAQAPALWLPAALLIVLSGALFVSRRRQV